MKLEQQGQHQGHASSVIERHGIHIQLSIIARVEELGALFA